MELFLILDEKLGWESFLFSLEKGTKRNGMKKELFLYFGKGLGTGIIPFLKVTDTTMMLIDKSPFLNRLFAIIRSKSIGWDYTLLMWLE